MPPAYSCHCCAVTADATAILYSLTYTRQYFNEIKMLSPTGAPELGFPINKNVTRT